MNKIRGIRFYLANLIFLAGLCITGNCLAQDVHTEVPNLVGTWTGEARGEALTSGETLGSKTHWSREFSHVNFEYVVTAQEGRFIRGIMRSPKATEHFRAFISQDNKILFADEDGSAEGWILGRNRIYFLYRHITPSETVVAVSVWTRKSQVNQ